MSQKRHTVDQIISKLCRGDVVLGKAMTIPEICKQLSITEQTYYCWRLIGNKAAAAKESHSTQLANPILRD